MTFFVHGLSGHETMPMNRLFEKRAVNKTDAVYAYHGVNTRHKDKDSSTKSKTQQRPSNIASQSYRSVEAASSNQDFVLAADIMETPVTFLSSNSLISEALELFQKRQFRHVPVLSAEKSLIGMVSDRDVLRYLGEEPKGAEYSPHTKHQPVINVMTTDVVSASSDTDVRYIARLFVEGRIGAMPIIDNGKLTGILTRSDILRAVMKNFHIGLWA